MTLADALRFAPGLLALESFGGFEPPRLSLRGSGLQSAPSSRGLALRLDGLPLNLADGSFNSALFDPSLGDGLVVQRGLDGWRAHPGVAGGALEVRTPHACSLDQGYEPGVAEIRRGLARESKDRGASAPPLVSARLEAGSFGAIRARASHSEAFGPLASSIDASFSRLDGYRPHSGQDRATLLAQVSNSSQVAGGLRSPVGLTATLYHTRARYEVPGPLTLAAALASPRTVSADVRRDQPRRESSLTWGAIALGGKPAGGSAADARWNVGVAFGHTADDFRQLAAAGITRSRSDDLHLLAGYTRLVDTAALRHRLSLQATASHGWRTASRFLNDRGTTGPRFARDELEATTSVLRVEDTVRLGYAWSASVGFAALRRSGSLPWQARDGERVEPANPAGLANDTHLLPAAAIAWSPSRRTALYMHVSDTAEPPTFDDLIAVSGPASALARRFQPLASQRIRTWEIGFRGQLGAGGPPAMTPLSWDIALFHAEWRNEILRLADANGVPRGAVNASPTTHEGVETAIRWTAVDSPLRVHLAATATWSNARFKRDPFHGRNRLAGLPPHFGQAELQVDDPRGFFGAVGARWTAGSTRVDHAGRLSYGGSAIAHVRLGWRTEPLGKEMRADRPRSSLTWFVQGENLFDRRAIASTAGVLDLARNPAATAVFLPVVGRSIVIGAEWQR